MDILNYSNNVIHILLEFFFDTIIEFFFWLDYHIISFGVIIVSKNTKLFAKKLHRLDLSAGIFVFCWEFHVLRMFFTTAGKLFCPRILSFRSGSRWVRAHFLGKPKGLPEKRRTRISRDLPQVKPQKETQGKYFDLGSH